MKQFAKKLAAILGMMTILGLVVASPSGAAGTASVTPNPVPVSSGQTSATLTVQYNFGGSNTAVFIDLCKKQTSDPTFNYTLDCDRGVANAYNGSANGSGSQLVDIPIGDTAGSIYFGDPIDNWGCYPQGFTPSAGFAAASQCYIRVTQGQANNNTDAIDLPYTFSVGGNDIPEVPVVVLPVLVGAALVGGFLFLNRRRALA